MGDTPTGGTGQSFMDMLGLGAQPNNPYAQPTPTAKELLFRTIASSMPPPGRLQVPNTIPGRLFGTVARLGGGFSDTVADELARQRLDPLQRQLAIARGVLAQNQPKPPDMGPAPGTTLPISQFGNLGSIKEQDVLGQPQMPPPPPPPNPFAGVTPEMLVAGGVVPGLSGYIDPAKIAAIRSANASAALHEQQARDLANDPIGRLATNLPNRLAAQIAMGPNGVLNPDKALEVLERLRTNPQGAEGRRYDFLIRKHNGNEELAWQEFTKDIRGITGQRAGGAEESKIQVRNTPQAAQAASNVAGGSASGRVTGTAAAQERVPLNERAAQFVHPTSLQYAPVDMTAEEAKKAGYVTASKSLSAAVPSARAALQTLDKYEELTKKLLVPAGKGTARDIANIQSNRMGLYARLKAGDPDVAEFASLSATLPTQVKAFGDTGNIAIKEQEFQARALPNNEDSLEGALRKIETRRHLLKNIIRSSLAGQSRSAGGSPSLPPPPNTPKVDPEVQKYLDSLSK